MLRSIASVIAGFVVWSVLWLASNIAAAKVFPDRIKQDGSVDGSGLLAGFVVFSAALSLAAGYLTARIAPSAAVQHALVVGVLLLLVGIAVQTQYWKVLPLWYHLAFLAVLVPGCILGAKLAAS